MRKKPVTTSEGAWGDARGNKSAQASDAQLWQMTAAIVLLLTLATLLAYRGLATNEFVDFDDPKYVTANGHIRAGLTAEGLKWALTDVGVDYWHPLTWASHMLDVSLFGMWAGGHHLVSLGFHIVNALLLLGFLRYTTKRLWTSVFVAGLFALHPLHVESVAWVAERKDVLSTFFLLAAMWMYAYYAKRPGWARYAGVAVLFALGLMSKPMLVTLPVILLLLDYWPLERFNLDGWKMKVERVSVWQLLLEKVLLAGMAIFAAVLTVVGQYKVEAMATLEGVSIMGRLWNAFVSYWRYIGAMVWPEGLAALYPYYDSPPWWQGAVALLLLIGTSVAVYLARSRKYITVGWLWYLIMLVPVIGLVQVGPQSHADRYTYVSLTGLFVIIAWLGGEAAVRDRTSRVTMAIAAGVVLVALGTMTWRTTGYWKDTMSLAHRAISVTKRNHLMLGLLGQCQMQRGEYDKAYASLMESLRQGTRSSASFSWMLIARLFYEKGQLAEAANYGTAALEQKPQLLSAWLVTGMALCDMGRFEEAEKHLRKAIELDEYAAQPYAALARLMGESGRLDDGIALYRKSLEMDNTDAEVYFNLGVLCAKKGDFPAAAEAYGRSIATKTSWDAWNGLGDCLVGMGELKRAEQAYRQSIKIKPDEAVSHYNLAVILASSGRRSEAAEEAGRALKLAPENADAGELYRKLTTGAQ
jgi:tetratricopeptide (TPR) repeat protein